MSLNRFKEKEKEIEKERDVNAPVPKKRSEIKNRNLLPPSNLGSITEPFFVQLFFLSPHLTPFSSFLASSVSLVLLVLVLLLENPIPLVSKFIQDWTTKRICNPFAHLFENTLSFDPKEFWRINVQKQRIKVEHDSEQDFLSIQSDPWSDSPHRVN